MCVCVCGARSMRPATQASQHQHHEAIQFTAVASCDLLCSLMCCARPAVGRISFHRRACVRACVSRHFAAVQSSAQPPYPPIAHVCTLVIAKFHYTDPTGHARTRTDFFCDPDLRETPLGPCGSPTKSVRVQSGSCSGI